MFDLEIKNARLIGETTLMDIKIKGRVIAALSPSSMSAGESAQSALKTIDLSGRLLIPGLVDSHVHLDKACILERCPICEGTLAEAVALTARAKSAFTREDVRNRAQKVLDQAILHGTQFMRSFVEVDPRAGVASFKALCELRSDYAAAITLKLCAFAQEGLTQEMATYDLLDYVCANGADQIGGCPYTDIDPAGHIALIFELARKYDLNVDFHLDFDLKPERSNLDLVIAATERFGYGGRVSIGHVTQLSAVSPAQFAATATRLADAGISLCVLPATDLFLNGRDFDHLVPRGVTPAHRMQGVVTSLASNNILNPFTPYGDGSLLRMANLYANVTQAAQNEEIERIYRMISQDAAQSMGISAPVIAQGAQADLIALDATDIISALRTSAPVSRGWKAGRETFERPAPRVLWR